MPSVVMCGTPYQVDHEPSEVEQAISARVTNGKSRFVWFDRLGKQGQVGLDYSQITAIFPYPS